MRTRATILWVFAALCGPAAATVYELPENGSAVFGTDERIKSTYQDTLLDIARRYSLGYEEIIRANPGVDMWLPGEGTDILLPGRRILPPGPREGVVVNLPEHRLYYFPKAKKAEKPVVITYPVSIGKMDWSTPLGETHVVSKQKHPSWYPPESVRKEHLANGDPLPKVVPAGPDNPLGDFAMRLAVGGGSYMLHGTNNPMAVGMAITHGCIRMYPEDVAALFPLIPVGTKVWLINDPVKVAYVDGELYLEAHPPVDSEGQTTEPNLELLSQLLDKALGQDTAAIHWDLARATLQAANGIPAVVGLQAQLDPPPTPDGSPSQPPATGAVQAPTPAPSAARAPPPSTPPAAAAVPTAEATKSASAPTGSEPMAGTTTTSAVTQAATASTPAGKVPTPVATTAPSGVLVATMTASTTHAAAEPTGGATSASGEVPATSVDAAKASNVPDAVAPLAVTPPAAASPAASGSTAAPPPAVSPAAAGSVHAPNPTPAPIPVGSGQSAPGPQ